MFKNLIHLTITFTPKRKCRTMASGGSNNIFGGPGAPL